MKRIPTPRMIALIAVLFATATYAVTPQIPSDPDLVYVRVTASTTAINGYFRPVRGLHKEQFKITEDTTLQDIAYFSEDSLPLHVGVLLDDNGDTKEDVKAKALSGMTTSGSRDDEFSLLEPGKSPLNDAILKALNTLAQHGENRKHALVLYTSKSDPGAYTFSKVRDRLKELDIPLYVAGLQTSSDISIDSGRQALRELAELSGGSAFFPSSRYELEGVFRKIVTELKNQYRIGYRSTNRATDGKWRRIKITGEYVDPVSKKVAKLEVRAKPGYYAPRAAK